MAEHIEIGDDVIVRPGSYYAGKRGTVLGVIPSDGIFGSIVSIKIRQRMITYRYNELEVTKTNAQKLAEQERRTKKRVKQPLDHPHDSNIN